VISHSVFSLGKPSPWQTLNCVQLQSKCSRFYKNGNASSFCSGGAEIFLVDPWKQRNHSAEKVKGMAQGNEEIRIRMMFFFGASAESCIVGRLGLY
jgi:hypothetical protein